MDDGKVCFSAGMMARQAAFVFAISFFIGICVNLYVGPRELTPDEPDYHALAQELNNSGEYGFPGAKAYRAPLYPLVLSLVYRICGADPMAGRYLSSLLGAMMASLAFLIAYILSGRKSAGIAAAVLLMTDSYWWLNQTMLMQENLSAVLIAGAVALLCVFLVKGAAGLRFLTASGLLFGLSQLAKPLLLPVYGILAVLSVILFVKSRISKNSLISAQILGLCVLLVAALLPVGCWCLRNYSIFGEPVLITTGSGEVFRGSHAPETIRSSKGLWRASPSIGQVAPENETEELSSNREKWREGWDGLGRCTFSEVAVHFIMKIARTVSPSTFFAADTRGLFIIKIVLIILNSAVLIGFAMYVLARNPCWQPALILFISLLMTVFVFWGTIRFRYVLSPVICGYAAVFYAGLYERYRHKVFGA